MATTPWMHLISSDLEAKQGWAWLVLGKGEMEMWQELQGEAQPRTFTAGKVPESSRAFLKHP